MARHLKILISYRRSDSQTAAGRIFGELAGRFGKRSVFIDIDSVPIGVNFHDHIKAALQDADVLVALIGNDWIGATGESSPRISGTNDWVRLEIATALQMQIPIIPVLLDGTEFPSRDVLPAEIGALLDIQPLRLSQADGFDRQVEALKSGIERIVAANRPPVPPRATNPFVRFLAYLIVLALEVFIVSSIGALTTLLLGYPTGRIPDTYPQVITILALMGAVAVPLHIYLHSAPRGPMLTHRTLFFLMFGAGAIMSVNVVTDFTYLSPQEVIIVRATVWAAVGLHGLLWLVSSRKK